MNGRAVNKTKEISAMYKKLVITFAHTKKKVSSMYWNDPPPRIIRKAKCQSSSWLEINQHSWYFYPTTTQAIKKSLLVFLLHNIQYVETQFAPSRANHATHQNCPIHNHNKLHKYITFKQNIINITNINNWYSYFVYLLLPQAGPANMEGMKRVVSRRVTLKLFTFLQFVYPWLPYLCWQRRYFIRRSFSFLSALLYLFKFKIFLSSKLIAKQEYKLFEIKIAPCSSV